MNTIEQLKAMPVNSELPATLHGIPVKIERYEEEWVIRASNFETLHIESIDEKNDTLQVWAIHCHLVMNHDLPADKLLFDEH